MKRILVPVMRHIRKIVFRCGLDRSRILARINNFLVAFLKSNYADIDGHKMFLDVHDSLRLSIYGIYEPRETELVKREIKKGDVVLDIGANIGYYTLIFAKLVGKEGKVFAFEPDPLNFALLEKNVGINGYRNIVLVQKAVSNRTGKIKLYLCEDNRGNHRIYDSHDERESISIEAIRLDDYFNDYNGKIDFIKMDIEGAEGKAIQGMSDLLKKNNELEIITEFCPYYVQKSGDEPEEFPRLLAQEGFEFYDINEYEKKLEPIAMLELLAKYTSEKENGTNLLCVNSQSFSKESIL